MSTAMANTASDNKDAAKLPAAKWGAACTACATAKAKCIRSNPDSAKKCDRCQRLLKECTGQVHRPRKKRQVKPSRTAQIEERLNGLVNLLQASGELPVSRSPLATLSDAAAREQSAMTNDTPSASSTTPSYQSTYQAWTIPETYNRHAIPSCICRPVPGNAPPPPDSDDVLLGLFRSQMQPVFPFVIIPPAVSATELRATRPFLMSAIRMVTSFRSLRSMSAQLYRLMSHISDHVLIQSEKSLELLQGILVILAWYQYHCMMHSQLNNLLALAGSLIGDMGLNSPPGIREQARLMVAKPPEPPGRTNEERRALLGVWFMTCNVAVSFNRTEPMRYTSYVQDCLKVLEDEKEYESDITLLHLIKVQRLTVRIFELTSKDRDADEVPGIAVAPMSAYVAALQNEIDRLQADLPPILQNNDLFMTYFNTARLRLYEPSVVDLNFVKSLAESMTAGKPGQTTPLDKLYQSSAALRGWFDTWLSIPASSYFRLPLCNMSQLVYAITMLGRWAQLATPRTMYEGGTPMPSGAGSSSFGSADQIATNELSETRLSTRPSSCDPKSPCRDKELIRAVAALQSQLQSQLTLIVNIPEILFTLCSRCEQTNVIFQQTSPEEEKTDNNIWTFSALKIRITRVKLERWAELVAAAAEGSNNTVPKAEPAPQWRGSYPQSSGVSLEQPQTGLVSSGYVQDQTQIQNFFGNTSWNPEVLDGVDPTTLYDGYLDWGFMLTNSMGNPMASVEMPQVRPGMRETAVL